MIKKKIKKIKKKSTIKKQSVTRKKLVIKKKPEIKKEVVIEKIIVKEVIPEKPKKPEVVFFGTEYEKQIMDICSENKFPFDYRRAKIGGHIVDFINRGKRLAIEVYNPIRTSDEVQARLRAFLVRGFKTKYMTKDVFLRRRWKNRCVISIKRFLA